SGTIASDPIAIIGVSGERVIDRPRNPAGRRVIVGRLRPEGYQVIDEAQSTPSAGPYRARIRVGQPPRDPGSIHAENKSALPNASRPRSQFPLRRASGEGRRAALPDSGVRSLTARVQ